jgi:hypothetical protein
MHRYLHSYEDFLLVDEDYVIRAGSKHAGGPRSRPPHKRWESDDDDDFDSDYDAYEDGVDDDEDDDDGDDGDKPNWR